MREIDKQEDPMKKFYLIILVFFIYGFSYAQMSDGNYTFKNADFTLTFTISSDGLEMNDVVLTNLKTGKKENAIGEWFKLNMNGADADYSGPEGWYQFQTTKCNYDFNVPTSKLILRQFDCDDVYGKSIKYVLIKQD